MPVLAFYIGVLMLLGLSFWLHMAIGVFVTAVFLIVMGIMNA